MLCKTISKPVLAIEKTGNSSKNSFQDHQLNIDGKTSCRWLRSKSESFQDHSSTPFKTKAKSAKNEDSFKTNDQKTGKSVLSGPSIKSAKKGPKSTSFKTIESQNVPKQGSFKTIEDGSQNDTSFKTMGNKDQKSTSFKTIENRAKNLNPQYMVPIDEASQVISDPQARKKVQPVTEQLLSGPPPPGSRFNPSTWNPDQYPLTVPGIFKHCFPTVLTLSET